MEIKGALPRVHFKFRTLRTPVSGGRGTQIASLPNYHMFNSAIRTAAQLGLMRAWKTRWT